MCELCEWNKNYYSSLPIEKDDKFPGKPAYDINIRAIYSFREIDRGYRSLLRLCYEHEHVTTSN